MKEIVLENTIVLKKTGFTKNSKIFLDKRPIETEFIDEHTLIGEIPLDKPKNMEDKYLGRYNEPIWSSNIYTIEE
ncbi:MAG: hypothetical protein GX209_07145 [Epulopiscium sp.]|nr:hypothetical protein [Candidatus Epulonipiscium sp.]